MNAEAYRYGGHRRNLRVQEGLAAAPMFPVAVPVAAAGSFLQISHAIPRSENTREFKTAEYQRSDFKPKIQSGELHEKLLRQSQGLATVLVATGIAPVTWLCTRYVALHPIRTGAMPTDRVQCLRIGCTAQRSTTPKKSLPSRTHHPQTGTRSHKNPKHRRCGGRRRDLPRCPRAAAGPGQATHKHPDRLEAAARPAGTGRTTSRRAERSSRRGRRAGGQAARRSEICRGNKPPHTPRRHNKTARPQRGRAAVAVALGFEPRVAVTPHSISSAAPSAARTRYLTRTLYYTAPRTMQIDRARWEQGHTTPRGPTAPHDEGPSIGDD